MKDFYDIAFLLQHKELHEQNLVRAITDTFENRGSSIRAAMALLSEKSLSKETAWRAFRAAGGRGDVEPGEGVKEIITADLSKIRCHGIIWPRQRLS